MNPPFSPDEVWVRVDAVAQRLGENVSTVYRRVGAGELIARGRRGGMRIWWPSVLAFEQRDLKPPKPKAEKKPGPKRPTSEAHERALANLRARGVAVG